LFEEIKKQYGDGGFVFVDFEGTLGMGLSVLSDSKNRTLFSYVLSESHKKFLIDIFKNYDFTKFRVAKSSFAIPKGDVSRVIAYLGSFDARNKQNIMFQKKTIEERIASLEGFAIIAVHVIGDYQWKNTGSVKMILHDKSRNLYFFSSKSKIKEIKPSILKDTGTALPIRKKKPTKTVEKREKREKRETPVQGRLSKISKNTQKEYVVVNHTKEIKSEAVQYGNASSDITYDQWNEMLKGKIENLLGNIMNNKEHIQRLLSEDAMKVWRASFTDEYIDPKPEGNYQSLETLGDTVMKVHFVKFILEKFPRVTPDQMTMFTTKYVAKKIQALISRKLELPNYTRKLRALPDNMSLAEDLLEALFGALIKTSEVVFGNMMIGQTMAYNMIVYLYNPMNITLKDAVRNNVGSVGEILRRVDLDYAVEETKQGDETIYSLYMVYRTGKDNNYKLENLKRIGPQAVEIFNKLGLSQVNEKILKIAELKYKNKAATYKSIKDKLFGIAKDNLEKLGLTLHSSERIRFYRMLDMPHLRDIREEVLKRLRADNFEYGKFREIVKNDIDDYVTAFYGVRSNDEVDILTTASGETEEDSQRRCICSYIEKEC